MVMAPGGNLGGDAGVTGGFAPVKPKYFDLPLVADVAINASATWINILSQLLGPGYYLIAGQILFRTGAVAAPIAAALFSSSLQYVGIVDFSAAGATADIALTVPPRVIYLPTSDTLILRAWVQGQTDYTAKVSTTSLSVNQNPGTVMTILPLRLAA